MPLRVTRLRGTVADMGLRRLAGKKKRVGALRDALDQSVDFAVLRAKSRVKLFVSATTLGVARSACSKA